LVPSDRAWRTPPVHWKPYGWRLNGYLARNMNCVIAICTRKTTHWYFKTFDFKRRDFWKSTGEKIREKSKWHFLREINTRKKVREKIIREKSTGKKIQEKKFGKQKYGKKSTEKKTTAGHVTLSLPVKEAPLGRILFRLRMRITYFRTETSSHVTSDQACTMVRSPSNINL
jgi:hypothetical protein